MLKGSAEPNKGVAAVSLWTESFSRLLNLPSKCISEKGCSKRLGEELVVDAMVGAIFGMEGTGRCRLYHGLLGLQWAIEGSGTLRILLATLATTRHFQTR